METKFSFGPLVSLTIESILFVDFCMYGIIKTLDFKMDAEFILLSWISFLCLANYTN